MTSSEVNDLDYKLWARLQRTGDALRELRSIGLDEDSVAVLEAAVLYLRGGGIGPSDLAELSGRASSGVARPADGRHRASTVGDPDACHLATVSNTALGAKGAEESPAPAGVHRAMSCLSPGEKRRLGRLLEKLLLASRDVP